MRIRLGTIDGNTYASDEFTREEVQEGLDAADGYIGSGEFANHKFHDVDEALDFILDFAKYDKKNDHQILNLTIDGNRRTFNVCHIVWYELVLNWAEKQEAKYAETNVGEES